MSVSLHVVSCIVKLCISQLPYFVFIPAVINHVSRVEIRWYAARGMERLPC